MKSLQNIYESHYGCKPAEICRLSGGGSAREYYRLSSEAGAAVGVIGPDVRENRTFVSLARAFAEAGGAVPGVYGISADGKAYLQQDLGDTSLFSLLGQSEGVGLVEQVMTALPGMQLAGGISGDMLYPVKEMTRVHLMRDLQYFKYSFLKAVGVEPDEDALDRDFNELAVDFERTPATLCGIILRDCQSRNVMVADGRPWFIDFQSARRGPLMYDVASFLWQARAGFTSAFRERMAEVYISTLAEVRDIDAEEARASLRLMVWLRTMQVLGAYGLRGLTQRKAHFLQSIPAVMVNVMELLDSTEYETLTELRRCLGEALAVLTPRMIEGKDGRLRVSIFSFSYKKGYPDDFTGNGGGFMFDCRAMHNPGRYDEYKSLTGLDRPVIDFLEERGDVQRFLRGVMSLTEPAVARYVQRGFSDLQVGFGCTGGRHRSVYCAEHLAVMLRECFSPEDVEIVVTHREQKITHNV